MTKHTIEYGSETIEFTVKRRDRRTLEIRVMPDMNVEVLAPKEAKLKKIKEKIDKRGDWILKQQRYFNTFLPILPAREYISGEGHYYLGKQYKLKVKKSNINEVKLKGHNLIINTANINNIHYKKKLLYKWYRNHAEKIFMDKLDKCMIKLEKYGIAKPEIKILRMEKRWGSCIPQKQRILMNIELVRAPSQCIEYVIMHELCHLKHTQHDIKYFNLITLVMPDWRQRKERLEKVVLRR